MNRRTSLVYGSRPISDKSLSLSNSFFEDKHGVLLIERSRGGLAVHAPNRPFRCQDIIAELGEDPVLFDRLREVFSSRCELADRFGIAGQEEKRVGRDDDEDVAMAREALVLGSVGEVGNQRTVSARRS